MNTKPKKTINEEILNTLTLCVVNGMHLQKVNKKFILIKVKVLKFALLDLILSVKPEIDNSSEDFCDQAYSFALKQWADRIEELFK